MSFFSELRRRNVLRAATFYAASAWLIVQIATQVFPFFHIDEWIVRWIVIAALIGFPFAMLFSWFYEWTPQGIERESEVAAEASITHETGKKLERWTIAILGMAVVLLLADRFVLHRNADTMPSTTAPGKSIAVLPFENLSDDKSNAYFATGMQDEILTRLAGIHDLKVISRTSTEQYASHPPNLKVVAEQLGVATVLEGSVQKADGKVRINLQLIDAHTDSHLWAQNYDRDLKDVFAVQSDVAEKVAEALKAQLLPAESARITTVPTRNQEAYDRFLRAEYLVNRFNSGAGKDWADTVPKAEALYNSAIAADPGFALAYARLSYLKSSSWWFGIDPSPQSVVAAQADAKRALALQPNLPEAHLAQGYVSYWGHRDYPAALAEFAIARAHLPNDANMLQAIADVHRREGQVSRAISELESAATLDPRNAATASDFGFALLLQRRYADAAAACDRALALAPDSVYSSLYKAGAQQMSGDFAGSASTLAAISADDDPQGSVTLQRFDHAMAMRQPDAALTAIAKAPAWLVDSMGNIFVPVTMLRAQALALKGEAAPAHSAFLEAQQVLESRLRETNDNSGAQGDLESDLSLVDAGLGLQDAALQAGRRATELMPLSHDVVVGASYLARLAMVEARFGQTDSALDHVKQLLAAPAGHAVSAASLRFDPGWNPLRKDPRFQKLISDAEAAQARTQTRQ
jgi:TolB-like protein/Tfp pilus assembly protein PilF